MTDTDEERPDIGLTSEGIPRVTVRPQRMAQLGEPVDYDPFAPRARAAPTAPSEPRREPAPSAPSTEAGPSPPASLAEQAQLQRGVLGAKPFDPNLAVEPVEYDPFAAQKRSALLGHERDIDYKSGAPYWTRVQLQRASNPNEARLALEKLHGAGNYGQDTRGRWWVNAPDANGHVRKVAVMSNTAGGAFTNFGAGMQASATPIAGATLGAGIGALGGPFAPLTIPAGAGAGAAAGWGIDQLVKYYQGLYDQSPAEFTKHAGNEAALNALFAGAAPTARAISGAAGDTLRRWLGTTPTTQAMTDRLTDAGARVPIQSAAPNFRSFADKQKLRNIVMGDPGEEQNVAYLHQRYRDVLRSSGMTEPEIADFMAGVTGTLEEASTTPAGRAISTEVQTRVGDMAAQALAARNAAQADLGRMQQTLRDYANQPVGRLGQDVADQIVARRREFGNMARDAYGRVHEMAGGERVVPLEDVFARSQHFVDLAEPGLVPQYIRALAERGQRVRAAQQQLAEIEAGGGTLNGEAVAPELIAELRATAEGGVATLVEAHEIRSNLRELVGHDVDLTRTPYLGKILDVANTADNAITRLANSGELGSEAAAALRGVDSMYREGIARFYNDQIRKLVRDVRSGIIPDAEVVASTVIKSGHTEAANEIMAMMPQNIRDNIARVDLRNRIADASRRDRSGNMTLDGMKFLGLLDEVRGIRGLYTPQQMTAMRRLASEYAALDGKLDVTTLPPSQVQGYLARYIQHTRDIDEFVRGNPMAAYLSGRPDVVDRAVRAFVTPGNEAATQEAARYLGVNSPHWQAVQRHALRDLMHSAVEETPSRRATISGPSIESALKKYTRTQQELLFPNGMADDLKEVAKEARFLFPPDLGGGDYATSQAAKSITLHTGVNIFNPRTAYADARWIYTAVMGWVTDRPAVLHFLANTRRDDPGTIRAVLGGVAKWIGNEEMMGPGRRRPTQPPMP